MENKASILILIFTTILFLSGCNQQAGENTDATTSDEQEASGRNGDQVYDEALAMKLGADEYGMKRYIFALLKAGPNRDQDSTTTAKIQRAHLDNITRLANEGKLVAAGPFLEAGEFQGIYVFNVETVEEALELTQTDPAIQAGRLVFDFYPWYSSASLQLINEWHYKVAKNNP